MCIDARSASVGAVTEYHRLGDADIFHALKAVTPPNALPTPVVLCDRGDGTHASRAEAKRRWAFINNGHVADLARLSPPPARP